jgi:hypothetical protein
VAVRRFGVERATTAAALSGEDSASVLNESRSEVVGWDVRRFGANRNITVAEANGEGGASAPNKPWEDATGVRAALYVSADSQRS